MALTQLRETNPRLALAPTPGKRIRGGEHFVQPHPKNKSRVMKHTHSGFGLVVKPMETWDGRFLLGLSRATPRQYLERVYAQNDWFHDDTRLEGITKVGRRIGLAVSQRQLKGASPKLGEMKAFMYGLGFRKVNSAAFYDHHIANRTWYHPTSHVLVSDVKPNNFLKYRNRIQAVDLLVYDAPPGSSFHKAVFEHLEP